MKIGELAKRTDCSVQTIRHYEKEQLIASVERSEGNFRLYDEAAVEQLLFIKHCRSLDLSLPEIRQLLGLSRSPSAQCDDVNRMIDAHIDQVEARIQELTKLNEQLRMLRRSCSNRRTVEQCGILRNLSATPVSSV
ncbi:Cd(II)/Pb(II)-responsive transcriptional regulator [Oceanobacter antarcticus]|uniref:Cd(II)/Pb(II)-responsive transcriptional regulator n=1 Tax=Oceanobacter antarcticus TaxID=3133425 RepID=A0ABW8NP52_9GAMM